MTINYITNYMRRYSVLTITPLLAALLLVSCGEMSRTKRSGQEAQGEVVEKSKVRVEEVRLVPVDEVTTFTATVEADKVNNITPAMGGRIREIKVDVGSRVSKGQVLVKMDQATLSQQQTQVATLRRDYERYKELYEVGGISKQQIDQIKAQLDVAEYALSSLDENTTLTAPISGIVTARNYDPGDVAMQIPILTIESIHPVKVKVNVSESYYNRVTKGMPVEVKADALGDALFQGSVSLIHPTIDPVSHTFTVEVSVANSEQLLRPGMFARVRMNFGTNERPLLPDYAVLKQLGSNDRYVFVENEGKAIYTPVELGIRLDDKYEIISGLQPGDKVIVHGNTGLIDGDEVEVVQ